MKSLDPNLVSESDSKKGKGKYIIKKKPSAAIGTTNSQQLEYLKDSKEGENLFHSQLWMKRNLLHFIVDSGNQKNMILVKVINILKLLLSPHPQPYTSGWLR